MKEAAVRSAINSDLKSIAHLVVCDCMLRHVSKSSTWKRHCNYHINVCQKISLRSTQKSSFSFPIRSQIVHSFYFLEDLSPLIFFWFGIDDRVSQRRKAPTDFSLRSLSTAPQKSRGFSKGLHLYKIAFGAFEPGCPKSATSHCAALPPSSSPPFSR
ncbi:hypothetical protein PoB_007335200 [Plakobranchus ocellatus]|uniref:Uncharacterized protein n=1 Tax=Plakobranchus ocellatus TaxID=259542 RepID=A0AAV4DR99_9GAST|nr:hypothetical protein PoB_007335200 [Plakobranchus ocellatus]